MADRNTAKLNHLRFRMRRALPGEICILLLIFLGGCARPTTGFMRVGEKKYPAKPKEYEVLVFAEGETPQREYQVIGMVYTIKEHGLAWVERGTIINRLKQKAKKHGAHAIMDIKIVEWSKPDNPAVHVLFKYGTEMPENISGEAKAILFK